MYVHIYIYIYREREREGERERERENKIQARRAKGVSRRVPTLFRQPLTHHKRNGRCSFGIPLLGTTFCVRIVKPSGCHCTDAFGGNKYHGGPTPLRRTSPFSGIRRTGFLRERQTCHPDSDRPMTRKDLNMRQSGPFGHRMLFWPQGLSF